MDSETKQDLIVAALFHDIGKAIMRMENMAEPHTFVGASYLNDLKIPFFSKAVQTFIYDHHYHRKLSDKELKFAEQLLKESEVKEYKKILIEADRFDAGQREGRQEGIDDFDPDNKMALQEKLQKTRVLSFFSYAKDEKTEDGFDFFPLQLFSGRSFGVNEGGYSYSYISKILKNCDFNLALSYAVSNKSFHNSINNSLVWLREFTWFMPASTHSGENKTSLFEHSKNVAAITRALLDGDRKKPVLLILGDFSGIQNFIKTQTFKSEDQKGFTKRSRGRSFLVQIFTELTLQLILKRLNLDRSCLVLAAGGRFYILAPNSKENKEILQRTLTDINKFFIKYTDTLFLNIAWIEAKKEDFKPKKLSKLIGNLNEDKGFKCKMQRLFNEDMFEILFDTEFGRKSCGSCGFKEIGKYKEQNEKQLCEMCQLAEKIGEKYSYSKIYLISSNNIVALPKGGLIESAIFLEPPFNELGHLAICAEEDDIVLPRKLETGFFYCFLDYSYITEKFEQRQKLFVAEVLKLISNKDISFDFGFKPSSGTPELEKIAKLAENKAQTAKIAHLKLDVDSLGKFVKSAKTLSQISTMSDQLLLFFGKKVSELWNLKEEKDLFYTVFVGGDDLYIIGRYDMIFYHAKELVEQFKEFYNKKLSISGGITLFGHHYPMNVAMGIAAEECNNAKSFKYKEYEKDAISLFGKSIRWEDWSRILLFSQQISDSNIASSQLYRLTSFFESAHSRSKKVHILYYLIGRLKESSSNKDEEIIERLEKEIFSSSMQNLEDYQSKKTLLTLKLALLLRRIKTYKECG
ncbi:MAG: type III-A CRISPR-associated protein Cas10/Csm1 [Candidatus Diapherotrites archaeon]|nr:type III-A CRISPR-associated protein Cas10/Csm1 [Candidatus Diapherotrites archaeon]